MEIQMRIKKFDPELNVNLDLLEQYKDTYRKYTQGGAIEPRSIQNDGVVHNIIMCVLIKHSNGPVIDIKEVVMELEALPSPGRLFFVLLLTVRGLQDEELGKILIDCIVARHPRGFKFVKDSLAVPDPGPQYAFLTRQYFRQNGSKQYLVAKDFYDYFANADIQKLTYGMLPRNAAGFVQLPSVFDEGGESPVEWFYYAIGDNDFMPGVGVTEDTKEPDKEAQGKMVVSWYRDGYHSYIFEAIYDDDDYVKDKSCNRFTYISDSNGMSKIKNDVFFKGTVQFIFCLISYIHSGKPDLREFRNKIRVSKKNGVDQVRTKDRSLAQDPISLVGFGWKKPRNYEHKITEVQPYPAIRWYGSGRSKTRTVWITGHTREYGKEKDLVGNG
jgi:hypothetical protein